MKKIKMTDIKIIQNAYSRIFIAEDDDLPNRRKVARNERVIADVLNRITSDKKEQGLISNILNNDKFNIRDMWYKQLCNQLDDIGFEIEWED